MNDSKESIQQSFTYMYLSTRENSVGGRPESRRVEFLASKRPASCHHFAVGPVTLQIEKDGRGG